MPTIIKTQTVADVFLAIAQEDVGKVETPRNNQGEWIKKFWSETSYPDGYKNREPYCAAAVSFWLATLGKRLAIRGLLKATTGMTASEFDRWRCKSARAWDWDAWGRKARNAAVLPDTATPIKGDIIVFDFSHVGIVRGPGRKGRVLTIEANTGPSGERDGDGCWDKDRPQELARAFIRLPFMATEFATVPPTKAQA